jgi:uncharacterized membrane protein YphA (DoxX/SURF4 family)
VPPQFCAILFTIKKFLSSMKNAIKSIFNGSAASGTLPHETAYLLFRIYCGFSIAYGAGLSKVFHKIDENGTDSWDNLAFGVPQWFVDQVGEIGFTFISPSFWAHLAVYGEFIGGLLVALGLFTRISAIQLAFQFFVVSFIWYDEPMPFAMYYQQLIFWGFVLIAAVGGGRFSLDARFASRAATQQRFGVKTVAVAASMLLLPLVGAAQQQTELVRVSFTISNPSLKAREIDIRYFDSNGKRAAGYGYTLNALGSHAVNMPVGTRVYEKKGGRFELDFVVTSDDNGRRFDITKDFEISREQYLQASYDELNAETARLEKAETNPTWEETAKAKGYEMVTFRISGRSILPKQAYVRVQLPFDNQKSNVGFSRSLSRASEYQVAYPVGSKVYVCDGEYWNGTNVKETLLLTVDAEKKNYLFRI